MCLLVRKIDVGKWRKNNPASVGKVSADAITCCLNARSAMLSFWEIADETSIDDAVIAIASAMERLDTIHVVMLPGAGVKLAGLQTVRSAGITAVPSLADTHRDIVDLSYDSLGAVANLVLAELHQERERQYTRKALRDLLSDALESNRIDRHLLKERMEQQLS